MAYDKAYQNSKWKKGVSGNPRGKAPLPPDLHGVKKLFNQELVEKTFIKYMTMTIEEFEKIGQDKSLPALDHVIMMIIRKAGLDGDQQRLDFLLNRTIGKVADKSVNTNYDVNINAQLDMVPKDKLINLLKDADNETFVEGDT